MAADQEAYDPTAPEGDDSRGGQYMTKRDLKNILLVLVGLGIVLTPIYKYELAQSESSRCTQNMMAIQEAINLYATEHDGRFPPIDRTDFAPSDRTEANAAFTLAPTIGETGHVYTWISDVSAYMKSRASFQCPTAKPDELVVSEDPQSSVKTLSSSYGMYAPYGGFLTSLVENPDQTVIIAETSNGGAETTYDPSPFKGKDGTPLPDGFAIGYSDDNLEPSGTSQYVSRLAFPGTTGGKFTKDGDSRHGGGIHMLTASGQLIDGKPLSGIFRSGKTVNPTWTAPVILRAGH